jgi:hypothetical protein
MPCVSNLARQEAMLRELDFCRDSLKRGFHSKATKEYLLRSIRELERQLSLESVPYNSSEF